jgi:hypothetical protein
MRLALQVACQASARQHTSRLPHVVQLALASLPMADERSLVHQVACLRAAFVGIVSDCKDTQEGALLLRQCLPLDSMQDMEEHVALEFDKASAPQGVAFAVETLVQVICQRVGDAALGELHQVLLEPWDHVGLAVIRRES